MYEVLPRLHVCVLLIHDSSYDLLLRRLDTINVSLSLGITHLCGVGRVWNPTGTLSWGSLLHHTVDLL